MATKSSTPDDMRKELLDLVSQVKARLVDRAGDLHFPIPKFCVIGNQSVGKSRLLDAFAGEPFNFVAGGIGTRRPTFLEFRHEPAITPNRWSFSQDGKNFVQGSVREVMEQIQKANASLGQGISKIPIHVKVEGADCADISLVDLPGIRAIDDRLKTDIDQLIEEFMKDTNNILLCVEEAKDQANYESFNLCSKFDTDFRRTILIQNKLDKYYNDLDRSTVKTWLMGGGHFSADKLPCYALSLPHWADDKNRPTDPFAVLCRQCATRDIKTLRDMDAGEEYLKKVGFDNLKVQMERSMQERFAASLDPLLSQLKDIAATADTDLKRTKKEIELCDDPVQATRSAGLAFAQGFKFLMEGALSCQKDRHTLGQELEGFHEYVRQEGIAVDDDDFDAEKNPPVLPRDYDLQKYLKYLEEDARVPGYSIELNGGAQFRRLMIEIEVYIRFAGSGRQGSLDHDTIINAKGVRNSPYDVVRSLLKSSCKEDQQSLKNGSRYVGARLKWFFTTQKEATVAFMLGIKGSAEEHMFSRVMQKEAEILENNETMKACVFKTFDKASEKQRKEFQHMYRDIIASIYAEPLEVPKSGDDRPDMASETMEETGTDIDLKEDTEPRVCKELGDIQTYKKKTRQWENRLLEAFNVDDQKEIVDQVHDVIDATFSDIRCLVADQIQLYAQSFFLLPMLRKLEGEMSKMELTKDDIHRLGERKRTLENDRSRLEKSCDDLQFSIDAIQKFKATH